MKKIAIQGIKGCFHHVSLIKFFWENSYDIVECKSFNQLTKTVTSKEANLGIIAIENSIIGSLLYNYIFLSNHNFRIKGSIVLYIEHHLLIFFGKDFNEILSHPIALQQCDDFISEYTHLRPIEYGDTALSSLYISKNMLKKKASIASKLAAKEYNLKIINKNIQSISTNFTKFFVIEPLQKKNKKNWDKSSLFFSFKLKNKTENNLFIILNTIANKKIIITRIVSIINRYDEYIFYIDIILNDYMDYEYFKSRIKKKSYTFSTIGEYINFILL